MTLSDHLLPLLRDHDCVIIPDFGGLVAEYAPARVQPGGRHVLHPPTRQVAFNQALTRNDGLLVDALRQHLGLPTDAAREAVRQAVAALHQELTSAQHTELPGIGVFRQLAGRGLQFEYTGTANLLPAAYGLPALTTYPVRATDVRLAREQQAELVPRLRAAGRGLRLRRVLPGATVGLLAGLAVAALYLANLHPALVPVAWREYVPQWQQSTNAPQQAALATAPGTAPLPAPSRLPVASAPTPQVAAEQDINATTTVNDPNAIAPAAAPAEVVPPVAASVVVAPAARPAAIAAGKPAVTTAPNAAAMAAAKPTTPVAVAAPLRRPVASAHRPVALGGQSVAAAGLLAAKAKGAKPVGVARPAAPAKTWKATAPARVAASLAAGTMKAHAGRFYVVVGSFESLAGAQQVRAKLVRAGRPSRVLLPDVTTRKYRVTAAEFASRPAAYAALPRLSYLEKGSYVYPLR